jgi:prepilin-type N-terminal cleavage/methylation domain-containing protein/prepilin-type processing-associated H-X9-DG protein
MKTDKPVPFTLALAFRLWRLRGSKGEGHASGAGHGFTLVELLVVVAIIATLAALLLPTLSRAKSKTQGVQCLNNLKQMTVAWTAYALDHQEKVVMNWGDQAVEDWQSWVRGNLCLDRDSPWFPISESTNLLLLQRSPLAPYGTAPGLWRCPSDKSMKMQADGVRYPRSRTLTLNVWLGGDTPIMPGPFYQWREKVIQRTSQIRNPGPTDCFVFHDAREDGFYPSQFVTAGSGMESLVFFPGSYHNGAGNFSFADGHVAANRWRDPRTCPPVQDHWLLPWPSEASWHGISSPGNPDVQWLREHAFPKSN